MMQENNQSKENATVILEEENIQKDKKKSYEYRKPKYEQKNTKKVEVILVNKNYIVVRDENNCGMRKYGSFSNVKVGDFIEI